MKRTFEKAYKDAKVSADDATKYSIVEPFTDSTGKKFKEAVLLDTHFFDGISPRNWGEKLKELVESRSANDPVVMLITDENGEQAVLQFAKPNERVTKDGKSNHKVIDKLWSTSDNMSKLAVVHIDEVITTSEENHPYHTAENSHQWLDENGWLHRNANVINQRNGNIYNLKIDIAKTADGRNILYATDGKINRVGNVNVDSLKIKGPRQNSNSKDIVAEEKGEVKYSMSDSAGRQLSEGQREYFKDSKVRDENGKLLNVYHGTDAKFTTFRSDKKRISGRLNFEKPYRQQKSLTPIQSIKTRPFKCATRGSNPGHPD